MVVPDPTLRDDAILLRGFESATSAALWESVRTRTIPRWRSSQPYGEAEARATSSASRGTATGTGASFAIVDADVTG